MSRLKIFLRGTQISDFNLDPQREYVGGRKESCDIKLQPEKGISREHFRIKYENEQWILHSISRFGEIYSQGQRVESMALSHGSKFIIHPYEFEFSTLEQSDYLSSNNQNDATDSNTSEKTVIGIQQQVPYLKMMTADGQVREMLRLEIGEVWAAGRDPACQIVIPDNRVSRRQFEIRKINGLYSAIDLASVNGTFINGVPLSSTEPKPLKSGDVITVLDNTLYFELHDPNFQYRVENIEVPAPVDYNREQPGFIDNPDIDGMVDGYVDENGYNPVNNQQFLSQQNIDLYQPNIFSTGAIPGAIPNAIPGQNQSGAQQGGAFNNGASANRFSLAKLKDNKPLFATVVILIAVVLYVGYDFLNPEVEVTKTKQGAVKSDDPFENLKPEEKELVLSYYSTAEKALKQQQFSVARENLDKLHKYLPNGYKDSKAFEDEALNGELTLKAQQEAEQREKVLAEQKQQIKDTLEKCEKSISKTTTIEEIETCLAPVTIIEPDNADKIRLVNQVQKMLDDARMAEEKKLAYEKEIAELKELFASAEKVNETGYPKKTIKAYTQVIESTLPDPEGLKKVSEKRIKIIRNKIDERNKNNLANAENFIKEGKLKEGILALKEALITDPDSQELKDKINRYTNDLRNQTKTLYQDAILDENFGNVDGSDTRPGAKDKWKKIIAIDLDDGEYYRKAFIKLRRYGVF